MRSINHFNWNRSEKFPIGVHSDFWHVVMWWNNSWTIWLSLVAIEAQPWTSQHTIAAKVLFGLILPPFPWSWMLVVPQLCISEDPLFLWMKLRRWISLSITRRTKRFIIDNVQALGYNGFRWNDLMILLPLLFSLKFLEADNAFFYQGFGKTASVCLQGQCCVLFSAMRITYLVWAFDSFGALG